MEPSASDRVVLAAADKWATMLERAVAAQEEGREGDESIALRNAILALYDAVRGRRARVDAGVGIGADHRRFATTH